VHTILLDTAGIDRYPILDTGIVRTLVLMSSGVDKSRCCHVEQTLLITVEHYCQVCLMIEAMADGAVKMGLSRDTAQKLAAHTLMVFSLFLIFHIRL